jgi:hypothetical protein
MNPLDEVSEKEYNAFYDALSFTLSWEGGYVNDPEDPGGETKWGIAKTFHPDLDIKNLTPAEAARIYYEEYWEPSWCDMLPAPLSTVMFDTAVLCGPGRAKQFLRESKGDVEAFLAARRRHHVARSKPKHIKGHLNRLDSLARFARQHAQK